MTLKQMIAMTAACVALATSSPAQNDPFKSGAMVPAGAVATINGRSVSIKGFVDALYERFRSHVRGIEALDNIIQTRIVEHEMTARGTSVPQIEVEAEYQRLAQRMKDATGGKMTIESQLEQSGRTKAEFLETLRISVALQRMASEDLGKKDVSPAEQKQWLRSRTIAAKIERDPKKLPQDAAARYFNTHVTRKDFAVALVKALPEDETVTLANSLLQADLARKMCRDAGVVITPKNIDEGYERIKALFESNPNHTGIPFEDYISERTGMKIPSYRKSPGFIREVSLHQLGQKLVPNDAVPGAYREQIDWYGPVYDIQHILIRGSDDTRAKKSQATRSRSEAKSEIENVMARIDKGEPFADAVKLYSEDRRSKFKGGTLSSFTPKQAQSFPALAEILPKLQVGDVRGPIESKAGFHVIRLDAKRPAPPLSEEIAAEVRKRIASDRFKEAWKTAVRGIDIRRFLDS